MRHKGVCVQLCCRCVCGLTMISTTFQRDVPQYMAKPWSITKVIARTTSATRQQKHSESVQVLRSPDPNVWFLIRVSQQCVNWFIHIMGTMVLHQLMGTTGFTPTYGDFLLMWDISDRISVGYSFIAKDRERIVPMESPHSQHKPDLCTCVCVCVF